jgi:hypothetical protein
VQQVANGQWNLQRVSFARPAQLDRWCVTHNTYTYVHAHTRMRPHACHRHTAPLPHPLLTHPLRLSTHQCQSPWTPPHVCLNQSASLPNNRPDRAVINFLPGNRASQGDVSAFIAELTDGMKKTGTCLPLVAHTHMFYLLMHTHTRVRQACACRVAP